MMASLLQVYHMAYIANSDRFTIYKIPFL